MTRPSPVTVLPARVDLLDAAARLILATGGPLPDLERCVVLLPELLHANALRRHLLEHAARQGYHALLGPVITTLPLWLDAQPLAGVTVPGQARRELLLVEALRSHPGVFGAQDPWQLAASLAALFDELTLHRVDIPADLDRFTARLQQAYGIPDRLPAPLGMEASIVHRLWQAWHRQLQDEGLLDPGRAQVQRLAQTGTDQHFFLVGQDDLCETELQWLQQQLQAGRAHAILPPLMPDASGDAGLRIEALGHAPATDPDADPPGACLDLLFDTRQGTLAERAARMAARFPQSPLQAALSTFAAGSAEQEARAIELQVRRWLCDGHQPIGIVTEDRRLGRRVRALLERAGITLQDPGGWALSTTSAAAALERWLQCVEEDFAHEPLLDVLKSAFVFAGEDRDALAESVYRLETDIIRHENIACGLARYRHQIGRRKRHLPTHWNLATAQRLEQLLNRLDQAADPLRPCLDGTHAPVALLDHLQESLQQLGLWRAFEQDPAGQRVLQEWRVLREAARGLTLDMQWIEFRGWLGSALERHDFRPASGPGVVQLLTLQQAQLGRFAGLVIGACDSEYLPVTGSSGPFFNDRVRRDLGLPGWPQQYRLQLNRWRRLLQAAPRVLLSWHREQHGELRTPSAWLALLEAFQQLGWRQGLQDETLGQWLEHPGTRVSGDHPLPLPAPERPPRAQLPAGHLPARLSVSAHGNLIDCPYRFFAASGLALKAREEVREALEKAEYGTLVHRCLEIFHLGRPGFPGPCPSPLPEDQRDAAIALLESVSRQVFSAELEDNFEHRAWLRRWLQRVPDYIAWQLAHQAGRHFAAGEYDAERTLAGGYRLEGRLDRLDQAPDGGIILDYKTGRAPKQQEVDTGEAVQLPSYALLSEALPARVEYLELDGKVATGSALQGAELATLTRAVQQRLETLLQDIVHGVPLPAWGDAETCRHCDFDGLCRKPAWTEPVR